MGESVKIHCCGVHERGHCFAIECGEEVIFLDGGVNISGEKYRAFLKLGEDATYQEVSNTVGAPILENIDLENVKGFCLSHEHSDHVSGIPFLYKEVPAPIFSTRPTIFGTRHQFDIHKIKIGGDAFIPVEYRDEVPEKYRPRRISRDLFSFFRVKVGKHFEVMWIPTEHSSLNAYCLAVVLPKKRLIFYTGDFKLDLKENRPPMNTLRVLSEKYEILLICETIGVEKDGVTGVEEVLVEKLEESLTNLDVRLILAAVRASEVPRIHSFEQIATKLNRRVALVGRSMRNTYEAMRRSFPGVLTGDYVMFEPSELKSISKEKYNRYIFLADARMWHSYRTNFHGILKGAAPLKRCRGEKLLEIGKDDVVIFSTTEPYEKYMRICQGHVKKHVAASKAMFYPDLHVSGHGQIGDYRILVSALNPEVVIPFHREKPERGLLKGNVLDPLDYKGTFYNPNDGDVYAWG
jgi:ribonuclease J